MTDIIHNMTYVMTRSSDSDDDGFDVYDSLFDHLLAASLGLLGYLNQFRHLDIHVVYNFGLLVLLLWVDLCWR